MEEERRAWRSSLRLEFSFFREEREVSKVWFWIFSFFVEEVGWYWGEGGFFWGVEVESDQVRRTSTSMVPVSMILMSCFWTERGRDIIDLTSVVLRWQESETAYTKRLRREERRREGFTVKEERRELEVTGELCMKEEEVNSR